MLKFGVRAKRKKETSGSLSNGTSLDMSSYKLEILDSFTG